MDNIIICGLDPSQETGYAILETQPNLRVMDTGVIQAEKMACKGESLSKYGLLLQEVFGLYKPTFIVCEDLNYTRNLRTVKSLAKLQGIIEMEGWIYNDCPVSFFTATEARKKIGVKGSATKEEVAKYLKEYFKSDTDVDWKDTNITDALAIALAMWKTIVKETKEVSQ